MKHTRRRVLALCLAAALCLAVLLGAAAYVRPVTRGAIRRYVLRNEAALTAYAQQMYEQRPAVPGEYNGWETNYYFASDAVQFDLFGWGIVPASGYTGIYYAPQDVLQFDGQVFPIAESTDRKNGTRTVHGEGDNVFLFENITGHWYWYRASF